LFLLEHGNIFVRLCKLALLLTILTLDVLFFSLQLLNFYAKVVIKILVFVNGLVRSNQFLRYAFVVLLSSRLFNLLVGNFPFMVFYLGLKGGNLRVGCIRLLLKLTFKQAKFLNGVNLVLAPLQSMMRELLKVREYLLYLVVVRYLNLYRRIILVRSIYSFNHLHSLS
jgi:hypothetical protein